MLWRIGFLIIIGYYTVKEAAELSARRATRPFLFGQVVAWPAAVALFLVS